uniref:Large ribosomal subunit protein bL34m n=1 Tax=Talaromyces marneffei PM1 TaxID=1077442 RepID=A0A093V814_TALMA
MQAFQFSKMAMPTLTSRITHNIRPQIRTTSWLLSSTSPSRTYSSLFSSISTTRPVLPCNNTRTAMALNPMTPLLNQIRSFSASACLAGKRATYRPSRLVQKRRHGFLARLRTRTGRKIIMRRRLKGRKDLSW